MIDIAQQIAYWRSGAREDWSVAVDLVERGRTRHGLFFVHLAIEKALKAHVCERTQDLARGRTTWFGWLSSRVCSRTKASCPRWRI